MGKKKRFRQFRAFLKKKKRKKIQRFDILRKKNYWEFDRLLYEKKPNKIFKLTKKSWGYRNSWVLRRLQIDEKKMMKSENSSFYFFTFILLWNFSKYFFPSKTSWEWHFFKFYQDQTFYLSYFWEEYLYLTVFRDKF